MYKQLFELGEAQFKRVTQSGSRNLRATLEVHEEDYSKELADILFALKESGTSVKLVGYIEVEDEFLPSTSSNDAIVNQEIENLHN